MDELVTLISAHYSHKDNFCFDQYQLRSLRRIRRFWFLCILAWTLIYYLRMLGALRKVVRLQSDTFPEYVRAIRNLTEFAAHRRLSKDSSDLARFGIVSNRLSRQTG